MTPGLMQDLYAHSARAWMDKARVARKAGFSSSLIGAYVRMARQDVRSLVRSRRRAALLQARQLFHAPLAER